METKTKNQLISLAFAASGIACAARLFTRDRVAEFGRLKTSGRSTNDRDIPVSDKEAMWRIAEEDFTLGLGCAGAAAGMVYYFQKAYGVEGSINGLALSGDELGGKFDDDLAGPNDDAVAAQVKRVSVAKKKAPDKLVRLFDNLMEEARSNGRDFGNTQRGDRPPSQSELEKYASSWKKGTAITRIGLYLTTHGVTGLPKKSLMHRLHMSYGQRFKMAFAETYADKARKAGRKDYAQPAEVARVQTAKEWADNCVTFFKEVEKERGFFNK